MFYCLITEPAEMGLRELFSIPSPSINLSIGVKVPEVIMIERGLNFYKALKANSGVRHFSSI